MSALDDRPLWQPHPSRLALDHPLRDLILSRHAEALEHGEPCYTDPATGFVVFTSAFLANRGRCCNTGCRHCPYVSSDGDATTV